ncbi:hypothetical protein BIFANG_02288 [Bifidobacterium angulatum DSM 20098 = JCM 7096]|uniref:Uncharacterized protein n=1 Tax=Bifidobacterium angulatum DSM 20098 = JCM 7096 TaxID=518635 RepID=C4FDA5_9BIFI|nr:hypothetical protein BIFANG_02288 [Bifidobacterium angulatum DSM 20098 = JCM 7096]
MGAVITPQHISPPRVAETMVEATFPPSSWPFRKRNGTATKAGVRVSVGWYCQ